MDAIKWYHCGKLLNGANFCPNCGVARPVLTDKERRAVVFSVSNFNKANNAFSNYKTFKTGILSPSNYRHEFGVGTCEINLSYAATYLKNAVHFASLAMMSLERVPNIPLMYGQLPMEMLKALPDFCEV